MLLACQLHHVGVIHNNLLDYKNFVRAGSSLRVVGFSRAEFHDCRGQSPALYTETGCVIRKGCGELLLMETRHGPYDSAGEDSALVREEAYNGLGPGFPWT
jgi:hypothetical protein